MFILDKKQNIFVYPYRGLEAAAMWANVFPEHKMQLFVVSSIYEESKKVKVSRINSIVRIL